MSSESTATSNPSEQVQQPAGGVGEPSRTPPVSFVTAHPRLLGGASDTHHHSEEHAEQSGKDHAESSAAPSEDEHPGPAIYPLINPLTYGSGILIAPACTSDGRVVCSPYSPEEQIRRYHEAKAKEQQGEGGEAT
ncbi:uncharacterized protein JCM10292_000210 [Rhodotorula paludigena]|uniref:uncharacterized protein n=1 Tax=Rhodotorula paludigena TaxID=86838 RepID=UPI00316E0F7D